MWKAQAASAQRMRHWSFELLRPPMQKLGSRRSWRRCSADVLAGTATLAWAVALGAGQAETLRPFTVVGDAIPASLTGAPGDPTRGRAIIADRQKGLCLLCHT